MWSKEDVDEWIDVLAQVIEEAYTDPELVRTAPHNQAIRKLDATDLNDPGQLGDDVARLPAQAARRRSRRRGDEATEDYAKAAT